MRSENHPSKYFLRQQEIKHIYPDTLCYRDLFNLQISIHCVFEI
jgi:hypothetical protein